MLVYQAERTACASACQDCPCFLTSARAQFFVHPYIAGCVWRPLVCTDPLWTISNTSFWSICTLIMSRSTWSRQVAPFGRRHVHVASKGFMLQAYNPTLCTCVTQVDLTFQTCQNKQVRYMCRIKFRVPKYISESLYNIVPPWVDASVWFRVPTAVTVQEIEQTNISYALKVIVPIIIRYRCGYQISL